MATPRTPRDTEKNDDDKKQEKELNKQDSFKLSFDFDTLPEDVIKQNAKGQSSVVDKIAKTMKFSDDSHKFDGKLDAETPVIMDNKKQEKPTKEAKQAKQAKQKSEIKTKRQRDSSVTAHASDMSMFKHDNNNTDNLKAPPKLKKILSVDNASEKKNKRFSFK